MTSQGQPGTQQRYVVAPQDTKQRAAGCSSQTRASPTEHSTGRVRGQLQRKGKGVPCYVSCFLSSSGLLRPWRADVSWLAALGLCTDRLKVRVSLDPCPLKQCPSTDTGAQWNSPSSFSSLLASAPYPHSQHLLSMRVP